MSRLVLANESIALRRRARFFLVGVDGITPALVEAGEQPQSSSNGGPLTNVGLGPLVSVGFGRYYSQATQQLVFNADTVIETRYKSALTAECPGETLLITSYDPFTVSGPSSQRLVTVDATSSNDLAVYFRLVGTDGITAATGENGGQPQVSVDDAAFTSVGISTLTLIGNNLYRAVLSASLVTTVGVNIETRYKSATTAECPGDSVLVVTNQGPTLVDTDLAVSPARITQRLLVENGWASDPDLTIVGTWPAYYDNEPDLPDNCITIYDTTPAIDSDLMLSGEQTQHEGITIRIRSKDHDVGAAMTRQLLKQLTEQVYFKYLTIGSHQYLVQCFAQLSIVRLGRDSKTKRTLHNINGFVAVIMRS